MPRYCYRCPVPDCPQVYDDVFFRLAEWTEHPFDWCPRHGHKHFVQVVTVPAVQDWGNGGQGRYFEHLSKRGETFYDRASYRRYLKNHGLTEWAPKRGMPGQEV